MEGTDDTSFGRQPSDQLGSAAALDRNRPWPGGVERQSVDTTDDDLAGQRGRKRPDRGAHAIERHRDHDDVCRSRLAIACAAQQRGRHIVLGAQLRGPGLGPLRVT
jgi:hypothetical protein